MLRAAQSVRSIAKRLRKAAASAFMRYTFVNMNKLTDEQAQAMSAWENDPEIRHLHSVFKSPKDYETRSEWRTLKARLDNCRGSRFGIVSEGALVGEFNFVFNHPAALKKTPKTAWIGIGIGEKQARGRGLGKEAMRFLEQEVLAAGGKRIELGVFEFNAPAIGLYEKMNYKRFETIPNFTWWDGQWWSDFRYEKFL